MIAPRAWDDQDPTGSNGIRRLGTPQFHAKVAPTFGVRATKESRKDMDDYGQTGPGPMSAMVLLVKVQLVVVTLALSQATYTP